MFSCEFCKIFKNLFFTENLRTTASEFFIHFTVLPPGELMETSLSIFGHVFSRHSNVMNIMNLNDLVAAAWKHTFLGDITVFLYVLTEFLWSTVLQLFTHGTPKHKIKSKVKLEQAVILRCSLKKCPQIFIKTLRETPVLENLFYWRNTLERDLLQLYW